MSLRDKIRKGDPIPLPLSLALHALTPVQRAGMWWRLRRKSTRVDAQVLSFGNITAGGTGKTPAVIERAEREIKAGHKVAVITRGYGSQKTQEPFLLTPDAAMENIAQLIGDEPALIRRRVPGVFLVKSADRVKGAQAAIKEWGCDMILLDDGYQSVALERDENIVLVDAQNPFGNGALLPRGILREPPSHLDRATEILLTRCDQAENLKQVFARIKEIRDDISLRCSSHVPTGLWRVVDGEKLPLDFLMDKEIVAACAIAQPETFIDTLKNLGAHIEKRIHYPDHAEIPMDDFKGDLPVIVTEKDAVRMENPPDNVYALGVSLVFSEMEAL